MRGGGGCKRGRRRGAEKKKEKKKREGERRGERGEGTNTETKKKGRMREQ